MRSRQRLASTYWLSGWPTLVAEWHPTRNAGLDPREVSHGSGRKIWWKCPRGPDHEWRASASNRTAGQTGCPFCAGRKVSVTNNLASVRPDLAAQWHPTRNGKLVPARIVAGSTRLVWWMCPVAADHTWHLSPHDRRTLEGGCPFCLGVRVSSTNSLAATRPRIAAEWHPEKNHGLTAHGVVAGCARQVWWRCKLHPEHEWRTSVSNRTLRKSRCPFCAGRKACDKNCLAIAHPAIAREWHPTRNGALTPVEVTPHASRKVWWQCASGHEWRTRVSTRTRRRGSACPACSGRSCARALVSFPAWDPTGGGAASVTRVVREEHRRIEQILWLLAADPHAEEPVLCRFAADLTAHLDAVATVLYPLLERASRRPFTAERALQSQLRHLVSRMSAPTSDMLRGDRLRDLRAGFQEHARSMERVILPLLEDLVDPQALEDLGARMHASRATESKRSVMANGGRTA
jgi:predicted secreted protein